MRNERIRADAGKKADWLKSMKGAKLASVFCAIVDTVPARVRRFVGRPGLGRGGAPVGTDLEQFVARLEGLPDAGPGIAERLGAIGFAAVGGVGERGPVERDEGAPGEIVEVGIGVGLDRGRVLDAVWRDHRRAIVGGGLGEWKEAQPEAPAPGQRK